MKIVARRQFEWQGNELAMGEPDEAQALSAKPEGAVRLGHISDVHQGKPPKHEAPVPEVVETWLTDFEKAGVDVVVVSGDLVERPGDRVGMLRMRHLLEQSGLPWVVVPGNHDIARPRAGDAFYELFGEYPRIERHAGVAFVLFDSMAADAHRERTPYERLDAGRSGVLSKGRVGEPQIRRVTGMLTDADRPRVMVVHHHLREQEAILEDPPAGAPPALMVPCLDADRLLDWAARHGIRTAFHGHRHAHWPPYVARERVAVFNSGSATRGKPVRRGRLVDVVPGKGPRAVWEVRFSTSDDR